MPPDPDAVLDLTQQLIALDSVNPGLVPGAAGERDIAAHLAARLEASGFDVELVAPPGDDARVSVLAVWSGAQPGRTVVVNGHLDTVGVDGMDEPFSARIEGDRLIGRGASDMKGGVAGIVIAAEELVRRGVPGRVVVTLVADEEDASVGASAVLDRLRERDIAPDVCVIAEPTWLDLAVAHRGFALYEVTLTGRAAHSSQPELAVDVMPAFARLLADVSRHDAALHDVELHPLLPHGSLMTTVAHAGSAPFTIAARAELSIERRTVPGEPVDVGLDELRALVSALGAGFPDVAASVETVVVRSPWQLDAAGPAAELADLLASCLVSAGRDVGRLGAPYWMESALWQEAGVPTLVCGPAGGGLHAVDEWVDLEQLRVFPGVLTDAVEAFLRSAARG